MQSFMLASSLGSQSSDFEHIGKPIDHSEYEPSETVLDDLAAKEFGPRQTVGTPGVAKYPEFCRRTTFPLQDGSTQTDTPLARSSDQNFVGFIPYRGTDLVTVVPRSYAFAVIFIVFFMITWYFLMNRGNYYYVRLEIGGFGMN